MTLLGTVEGVSRAEVTASPLTQNGLGPFAWTGDDVWFVYNSLSYGTEDCGGWSPRAVLLVPAAMVSETSGWLLSYSSSDSWSMEFDVG